MTIVLDNEGRCRASNALVLCVLGARSSVSLDRNDCEQSQIRCISQGTKCFGFFPGVSRRQGELDLHPRGPPPPDAALSALLARTHSRQRCCACCQQHGCCSLLSPSVFSLVEHVRFSTRARGSMRPKDLGTACCLHEAASRRRRSVSVARTSWFVKYTPN